MGRPTIPTVDPAAKSRPVAGGNSPNNAPSAFNPPPAYPWSSRRLVLPSSVVLNKAGIVPPTTPSPCPFPRSGHSLSATATVTGNFYIFGGLVREIPRNDLYLFSTRDNSATLLQTGGEIPSPRVGHASALVSNVLIVWGGDTNSDQKSKEKLDDGLYRLNLISREWTRVSVSGPGPGGRHGHAVTMVGSQFIVFGGQVDGEFLNELWSFDVNSRSLRTRAVWKLIEPSQEAPARRTGHVCVTFGERILIFGGNDGQYHYNDTWAFDINTCQWSELQCIGYIPQPREGHAAAVIDGVMYVFGGRDVYGKDLTDLAAFKISNQRWYAFQNMGPAPSGRSGHSMATVNSKIYVLGGESSIPARGEDPSIVNILDTKHIKYPPSRDPPPTTVQPSAQGLSRKLSAPQPTNGNGHPMSPNVAPSDPANRSVKPVNSFTTPQNGGIKTEPIRPKRDDSEDDSLDIRMALMDVMQQYDDLDWVEIERITEEVYQETRTDRWLQLDKDHLSDPPPGVERRDDISDPPGIDAVCAQLSGIVKNAEQYRHLVNLQGPDAQGMLDLFQALLDLPKLDKSFRSPFLNAMIQLSTRSSLFPSVLLQEQVTFEDDDAITAGNFGDVYRGQFRGQRVAVKVFRIFLTSNPVEHMKGVLRETLIWRQLRHPNVLPFLCLHRVNNQEKRIGLVSPWMNNGNLKEFLRRTPDVDRVSLVNDVAEGLKYLHTMQPTIVHGDLKAVNILISDSFCACLADFGLSKASSSQVLNLSSFSSGKTGGTARWMAPELLEGVEEAKRNIKTDVYSFGCVCFEIFSGTVPFPNFTLDHPVIFRVTRGERPSRPEQCEPWKTSSTVLGLDDNLWGLVQQCWVADPSQRPNMSSVIRELPPRKGGPVPASEDYYLL